MRPLFIGSLGPGNTTARSTWAALPIFSCDFHRSRPAEQHPLTTVSGSSADRGPLRMPGDGGLGASEAVVGAGARS